MAKQNKQQKANSCKEIILGVNEVLYGVALDLTSLQRFNSVDRKCIETNARSNLKKCISLLETVESVFHSF